MELSQKKIFGGIAMVAILGIGIFVVDMPLLAFIFATMVLIFSISKD